MNSNGQARIGIRSAITNSPIIPTTTISASLLQSLYGAWNGDTTTNELSTSLYGVWNGEYSGTASLETSLYGAWNGEALGTSLDTSIYRVYNGDNLNDTSGNSQNGTNVGGVTFTTGKVGNAFTFNGSNYVTLPNNSLNSLTGDFSISTWVNLATLSGSKDILSSFTLLGGNYYGVELYTSGTSVIFSTYNGTTTYLPNNLSQVGTLSTNTWYNIVITRKASIGTKMYINGTLNVSNTSTQNPVYAPTNYATIGASNAGGSYVNFAATNTKIDTLSIWNRELTATEITSLYNVGNGVEYPFSSQTLPSLNDATPNANHGTRPSSTLTGGALGPSFTTGKIGNAFSFDGVDDYIALPNNIMKFSNTDNWSVSFWIYATVTGASGVIGNWDYDGLQGTGWGIRTDGTSGGDPSKFTIVFWTNWQIGTGNMLNPLSTNGTTSINTWNHFVITRNSSAQEKIYQNGILVASQTNSSTKLTYPSTSYSCIGAERYRSNIVSYAKAGSKLDAVNVWTKELTSNEVSMLYNGSNGTQYQSGSFGLTQSSLDSFGTYHGTLVNTTYGTGKIGSAFNFTGGNINMGTGAANFGTNPFTISLWFYPNAGNNLQVLVAKGFTGGTDKGFYLNTDNRYNSNLNGIAFGLNTGGTYRTIVTTSTFPYTAAAWNHLVVTRSGNTTLIYLNGVLTSTTNAQVGGTADVSGDISNTGANMLLAQYGSGGLNFAGRMDGLTMWSRVVSVDEVTQLYNSGTGAQYPFTGTFSSAINQLGVDNGTLMNGCYLSDGKIGKAFTFDGVNDYIDLPNNSMNFTGDFSVSGWINQSSIKPYHMIIGNQGTSTGNWHGWLVWVFNNKLTFDLYNGNSGIASGRWQTTTTLSTNTWIHFTITKKPGQAVKIYLDGVIDGGLLSGSNSANVTYTTTNYATIGLNKYSNPIVSSDAGYWHGKIDSLNVYQKELTQSEITELYNSGNGKQITATPIVQSGLVLNLDASRTSSYPNTGTIWSDISGNGNNGTMTNGPIFGTANGGAITFDGVNDRITLQSANISATGNWTISSWFNLSSLPAVDINSNLYSQYISIPGNGRMILRLLNESGIVNKFQLFLGSGSGYSSQGITGTTTAQINTFYNLVGIRNGSVFSLYLNGNLEASLDLTGTNISILQTTPEIGGTISGNFGWLNGKIYNTLVYNRALSANEVTQNFNVTKSRFGL